MLYVCWVQELLAICTSSWLHAAAPCQLGRLLPALLCPMARAEGQHEACQPLGNGFSTDPDNVGTSQLLRYVPSSLIGGSPVAPSWVAAASCACQGQRESGPGAESPTETCELAQGVGTPSWV